MLEIDEKKIKLCCDIVCGNKVMCFEYDGKIYKEGRKSMNYNLDYYVFDMCKELFGLNCIGMELRLGKFRIVKKDKSILNDTCILIEPFYKKDQNEYVFWYINLNKNKICQFEDGYPIYNINNIEVMKS